MKLKEIQRTATFAWSPRSDAPLLVSGSAAGAIDPDFSSATRLELWRLDLTDRSATGFIQSQPAATLETDACFYDLDFSKDSYHVAGALENGRVGIWGVESMGQPSPQLKQVFSGMHPNGAAHVVRFGRHNAKQLASGGANGQILIWNLDRLNEPTTPCAQTSRTEDVTDLAWNKRVGHILASTGRTGFTSIWDLNKRREVLHLHYTSSSGQRLPVSSVAWHPTNSTKLVTASIDDQEPVILSWDLRNASVPEKVMRGHTSGVLSLDWCDQDEQLLLSSGRDNRTLLWDPINGEMLGEYPVSVNWAFKTRFHPSLPDLFATSTLDNQIVVQTLQDTQSSSASEPSATQATGDDFWSSDIVMDTVHPRFTLQHAPAWLQRPVSATFGFGGTIAVVQNNKVRIERITDDSLSIDTQSFSNALTSGDLKSIAQARAGADWAVLSKFIESNDSEKVLSQYVEPESEVEDITDEFSISPAPYNPTHEFKLLDGSNDKVTKLVLSQQYEKAIDQLINAGEYSDALLVASYAPNNAELLARAQNAYLSAEGDAKPYLRTTWAVANEKVVPLAGSTELDAWPHTLRAVLASKSDVTATTKVLGDRLLAAGKRDDAVLVYLIGSNVAAAAAVWLKELPEIQRQLVSESNTAYAAHVKSLQQVIEKITIAQRATNASASGSGDEAQDEHLFEAFREYAQIVSSQGEVQLANTFLNMLPAKYHPAKSKAEKTPYGQQPALGRPSAGTTAGAPKSPYRPYGKRPANATLPVSTPAAPAAPAVSTTTATVTPVRQFPSNPYSQPSNPYAGAAAATASSASSNPYAGAAAATNPYANAASSVTSSAPAPAPSTSFAPPPRAGTAAASIAASSAANAGNNNQKPLPPSAASRPPAHGWNDLPEIAKTVRRTPVAPQIITPNYAVSSPVLNGTQPPPKAGTTSRRASGQSSTPSMESKPFSAEPLPTPNALPAILGGAPSPSSPAAPAIQRTVSNPYAPPPPAVPQEAPTGPESAVTVPKPEPLRRPSVKMNPYAAASAAPMAAPMAAPQNTIATPSGPGSIGIPPPTAATPTYGTRPAAFAPPPVAIVPPVPQPIVQPSVPAPAQATAPIAAPPPVSSAPPPGPARASSRATPSASAAAVLSDPASGPSIPAASATQAKYPPGDREHIPAHTKPIYETLHGELARVQPVISAQYPKQFKDTSRRLDILFDLLNNDSVLDSEAIGLLTKMTTALRGKDFEAARSAQVELHAAKSEQCGQWMTGVKRLIDMAAAIPT